MNTNYIIETKNLTKQYGSQKSVSLYFPVVQKMKFSISIIILCSLLVP